MISRHGGESEHSYSKAGDAKFKCVLQNPSPSFATRNQRDLLGHSSTPRKLSRGRHIGSRVTAHHRWYHAAYIVSALWGNRGQLQSGHKGNAPWLLEDRLRISGARYIAKAPWTPHAIADGNLITGQQNYSAGVTADVVLKQLAATV